MMRLRDALPFLIGVLIGLPLLVGGLQSDTFWCTAVGFLLVVNAYVSMERSS